MNRFAIPDRVKAFLRVARWMVVGLSLLLLAVSAFALSRANEASLTGIAGMRSSLAIVVDQSGYVLDCRAVSTSLPWDVATTTYEVDPIIDTMEEASTEEFAGEVRGAWAYRAPGVGVYYMPDATLKMKNFLLTCRHWVACAVSGIFVVSSLFRWRCKRRKSHAEAA